MDTDTDTSISNCSSTDTEFEDETHFMHTIAVGVLLCCDDDEYTELA